MKNEKKASRQMMTDHRERGTHERHKGFSKHTVELAQKAYEERKERPRPMVGRRLKRAQERTVEATKTYEKTIAPAERKQNRSSLEHKLKDKAL